MTTGLRGIATKSRSDKKLCFTSLAHHVTPALLWDNLNKIPTKTGVGVDGLNVKTTKEKFAEWSEVMLKAIHRKGYTPPPTRRVYIPKPGKSEKRPIAVPTVSDRALQKSVADTLNAIYEEDFLDCSYGGRPKRNAHQAIATLHTAINARKVSWVFEADLKNFFGSLSQEWVKRFISLRVGDPRILTLIRRWMKAGVLEEGKWIAHERGTAQGGPISVLISNIFLHYVLDLWVEKVVKLRMRGEVYYVRYLDDFVLCFQYHSDAKRFTNVLEKRLNKFELALEPSKTRLIRFGRFTQQWAKERKDRMETFSFLGVTFYCSKNRYGRFKVGLKTEKSRLNKSMVKMHETLRRNRHRRISEQHKLINNILLGHYHYYGVADNWHSLDKFYYFTLKYWRKVLSSRSQNGKVSWDKFNHILRVFPLRKPKITLPYQAMEKLGSL